MEQKKKKLGIKLMLIMFALIPLVVAVLILAIVTSNIAVHNLEENTKEELLVATKALREYYEYDLINGVDLVDDFLEYDTTYIDEMRNTTGVDLTIFKDNIRFATTIKDSSGKRIEGTPASDAVWAAVKSGQDYYSNDVKINNIDYFVYYMPLTDGHTIYGMAFSGKPATQVQQAEKTLYGTIIGISVALIAAFTVIALLFAKKVANPLRDVAAELTKLSDGKTDIKVNSTTNIEETSEILLATEKLGEVLKRVTTNIRNASDELNEQISTTASLAKESSEATDQISDSMQALAQTTMSMAENVQDINDNVLQMNDVITQAIENVENLNQNAGNMAKANDEASRCISDVVKSSEKSSVAVDDISTRINATNTSIVKINEMVDLISGIASQTNLLSLNASIEAARAGEAGRGFAVVAEEIKTLAEQSNVSANQIKDIVAEIGSSSQECVEQAERVKKMIAEEKEMLAVTQKSFTALDGDIKNSVDEITSVSSVTKQLANIKDTIMNAVSDLSAISEETSATNEEVAASVEGISTNINKVSDNTETMTGMAENLVKEVSYFS